MNSAIQQEALDRAQTSNSVANLPAIFAAFAERGITDIQPRVNVFTFHAWRALGRTVRRGEKGVRVITWVPMTKKTDAGDATAIGKRPRAAYVFHVSQTIGLGESDHREATFQAGAL